MTPLDTAHAAMEAAPEDDTARLRFYDRLAGSELFLMLEAEPAPGPEGDHIRPAIFPAEGGRVALVFDREDRLTDFTGGEVPYAALPGRQLAEMLAGQGIGLGVNLGVASSSILIGAEAVDWLAATLAEAPAEVAERPTEITPPHGVPEMLLRALDGRLAATGGLARMAYLAGMVMAGGRRGHLMAFIDPVPGSEPALARAVGAALTFSGVEAGSLDVGFFRAADPMAARLARVGLRFDLPEAQPNRPGPAAPGMDPATPPRLR